MMNNFIWIILISMLAFTYCNEKKLEPETGRQLSENKREAPGEVPDNEVRTLLSAGYNGEIEVVRRLISEGADVNAADESQQTALMLSAFNGHTDVVRLLLENGASVTSRNRDGRTALMFAASGPFPDTAELLLEAGAEPNVADNVKGWTAIMFAAAEGNARVIRVLLEYGADPSLKDKDGETALEFASNNGHAETEQLLRAEK